MLKKITFKDVTNELIKETEDFIEMLDRYEPVEVSMKQILDSYEESKDQ